MSGAPPELYLYILSYHNPVVIFDADQHKFFTSEETGIRTAVRSDTEEGPRPSSFGHVPNEALPPPPPSSAPSKLYFSGFFLIFLRLHSSIAVISILMKSLFRRDYAAVHSAPH